MKKLFLILILIIYALSVPSFVFALTSPELKIWKVNPFTRCPICGEYFTIGNNQNLSNLDLVYGAYLQDNQYNLYLFGSSGTSITLFGEKDFGTKSGFLTIVKTDDNPVYITDLENFPPDSWTEIGMLDQISGGYRAYYHPYPDFGKWVTSVKWGNFKSHNKTIK